jgi:hypothetical protein
MALNCRCPLAPCGRVPREVEGCAALVDVNSAITRMIADANLAMRNVLVAV